MLTYGVLELTGLELLGIDVDGAGTLVDGFGTDVVTGLYVLTLVDVDTLELVLLDVYTELDDGVDTLVLMYGVLVLATCDCVLSDVDSV